MSRTAPALAALLMLACAPQYRPGYVAAPLFEEAGQVQFQGNIGTGGFEAHVAYAPVEHVAVHGGVQVGFFGGTGGSGTASTGPYVEGTLGIGAWKAGGPLGQGRRFKLEPRLSVWAEAAGGHADSTLTVQWSGGSTSQVRYVGNFIHGTLQGVAALEGPWVAFGVVLRTTGYNVWHTDESASSAPTTQLAFVEPTVFFRAGPETLRFEAQVGLWLPFYVNGETGVPWPLTLSLGMIWQPDFKGIEG